MYPAVLLVGPPGTGKSSLCRAAIAYASELSAARGIPLRSELFSPSDHSKWVGEGAKAVKRKYERIASSDGTGILVLDDLDMVFQSRDDETATHGGLQVTGELMQQLSGVSNQYLGNTLVLGTTNREDHLDEAVARRFSQRLIVPSYSRQEQYVAFLEDRLDWATDDERASVADHGFCNRYSPAEMDQLCRYLFRERRGRPGRQGALTGRWDAPDFNLSEALDRYAGPAVRRAP